MQPREALSFFSAVISSQWPPFSLCLLRKGRKKKPISCLILLFQLSRFESNVFLFHEAPVICLGQQSKKATAAASGATSLPCCFMLRASCSSSAAQQHSTTFYIQSSPQKSVHTTPGEETHLGQLQASWKTVTGTSWSMQPLKLPLLSASPISEGTGEFILGRSDVNPILCLDSGAIWL